MIGSARRTAKSRLITMGDRWLHTQSVGQTAQSLADSAQVPDEVVAAAWLHDIGYASELAVSGFHPLDGARFLDGSFASGVVSLVAHHTGARFEAEERGLARELDVFARPDESMLDVLTFIDMTTSPRGERVTVHDRLAEILARYRGDHPVHRAVSRSRGFLTAACERATSVLDLSDEWFLTPV